MTTGSGGREAVMGDLEQVLFSVLHRTHLHRPLLTLLRSDTAWKLSGLSLTTAMFATTGSWGSIRSYIGSMELRWDHFKDYVPANARVLDFGTGLGGNLLGLSGRIRNGVGLDVNRYFVRYAQRIAHQQGYANLSFTWYDGHRFPALGPFDLVTSIGAFERIPKDAARTYLRALAGMTAPSGRLILYFLTPSARAQGFGRLLGTDAYVFWEDRELQEAFAAAGLRSIASVRGYPTAGDTHILEVPPVAT